MTALRPFTTMGRSSRMGFIAIAVKRRLVQMGVGVDQKPVSYTHLTLPTNREV